jgi:hypothetical protein
MPAPSITYRVVLEMTARDRTPEFEGGRARHASPEWALAYFSGILRGARNAHRLASDPYFNSLPVVVRVVRVKGGQP